MKSQMHVSSHYTCSTILLTYMKRRPRRRAWAIFGMFVWIAAITICEPFQLCFALRVRRKHSKCSYNLQTFPTVFFLRGRRKHSKYTLRNDAVYIPHHQTCKSRKERKRRTAVHQELSPWLERQWTWTHTRSWVILLSPIFVYGGEIVKLGCKGEIPVQIRIPARRTTKVFHHRECEVWFFAFSSVSSRSYIWWFFTFICSINTCGLLSS